MDDEPVLAVHPFVWVKSCSEQRYLAEVCIHWYKLPMSNDVADSVEVVEGRKASMLCVADWGKFSPILVSNSSGAQ